MMLGTRRDGAVVAKALCFRQPEFDVLGAEETALRWGFPIEGWAELEGGGVEELAAAAPPALPPTIVVNAGHRTKKVVHRDGNGAITSVEEIPVDVVDTGGPTKKVVRRDAEGNITEVEEVPVADQ
jgi:hypothetical protein